MKNSSKDRVKDAIISRQGLWRNIESGGHRELVYPQAIELMNHLYGQNISN